MLHRDNGSLNMLDKASTGITERCSSSKNGQKETLLNSFQNKFLLVNINKRSNEMEAIHDDKMYIEFSHASNPNLVSVF